MLFPTNGPWHELLLQNKARIPLAPLSQSDAMCSSGGVHISPFALAGSVVPGYVVCIVLCNSAEYYL